MVKKNKTKSQIRSNNFLMRKTDQKISFFSFFGKKRLCRMGRGGGQGGAVNNGRRVLGRVSLSLLSPPLCRTVCLREASLVVLYSWPLLQRVLPLHRLLSHNFLAVSKAYVRAERAEINLGDSKEWHLAAIQFVRKCNAVLRSAQKLGWA